MRFVHLMDNFINKRLNVAATVPILYSRSVQSNCIFVYRRRGFYIGHKISHTTGKMTKAATYRIAYG